MKEKSLNFGLVLKVLVAFILVFSVAVGSSVLPGGTNLTANAKTVDELKKEKENIQKKIEEKQKKLEGVQQEIGSKQEELKALNDLVESYEKKIANLQKTVDTYNARIDELNGQIEAINEKIKKIDAKIKEYDFKISQQKDAIQSILDVLKGRLKANYMAGGVTDIEVLMSSENLTSFLTRLEILDRVADYDDKLISDCEESIKTLEELQAEQNKEKIAQNEQKTEREKKRLEVEESKKKVEKDISELENDKQESAKEYDRIVEVMGQLDEKNEEYQRAIANLESEESRVGNDIEKFLNQNGSKSTDEPIVYPGDNGKWRFPLRDKSAGYRISSPFGWRVLYGKQEFHKGMDICSPCKDVVATRSGTVIQQGYHYSMGNYVMIDHGDGFVSTYMHFSQPAFVHNGQTVQQGQLIGHMGTTGHSYGVHLHFQINKDGTPVNPRNYVSF